MTIADADELALIPDGATLWGDAVRGTASVVRDIYDDLADLSATVGGHTTSINNNTSAIGTVTSGLATLNGTVTTLSGTVTTQGIAVAAAQADADAAQVDAAAAVVDADSASADATSALAAAATAQAAADAAQAAVDALETGGSYSVTDFGATEGGNLGAVMQTIIDLIISSGDTDPRRWEIYIPPGTWRWTTPCYFDPPTGGWFLRIFGAGKAATVLEPTTAMNGLFMIGNNDLRAPDAGRPTNSASDSNGQMPRLEVDHLTVDGPAGSSTVSFIRDNDASSNVHHCGFSGLLYGVKTEGYSDGHNMTHCVWLLPVVDGYMYRQTDVGDALFIANCKGGSNAPLINLNNCNGGVITAVVGGVSKIRNSRGIVVLGHHWDSNVGTTRSQWRPAWDVGGAQVTFINSWWHAGPDKNNVSWGLFYLEINDSETSPDRGSDILMLHPTGGARIDAAGDPRCADINIFTGNYGQTRLRVLGARYGVYTRSTSDPYRESIRVSSKTYDKTGATITYPLAASDSQLDTLAATLKSGVIMSTGDFEVRGNKQASTWDIRPLYVGGMRSSKKLTAPTLSTASTSGDPGNIGSSTTRNYVVACMNADGHYGPLSSVTSRTATNGNVRLLCNAADAPQNFRIWYSEGATSVLTTPTAYVDVPCDGSQLLARDHGPGINMRDWITTSVPVPNSVATSDETWDGIVLPNGRKIALADAATTPEARLYGSPGDLYSTTTGAFYAKATGSNTKTGWQPLSFGILGYTSAVSVGATTTSSTFSNVDTTALSVDFTAPPSGQVIIRASAGFSTAATGFPVQLNLRDSVSGDIANTAVDTAVKATNITRPAYEQRITGLTPGTSYTVRLGWKIGGSTLATLQADRCSIVAQAA